MYDIVLNFLDILSYNKLSWLVLSNSSRGRMGDDEAEESYFRSWCVLQISIIL